MSSLHPVLAVLLLTMGFAVGALYQDAPPKDPPAPVRPSGSFAVPEEVVSGVTIAQMVIASGQTQPQEMLVERVQGPWLELQVLKGRTRKGSPYWIHVETIGAFRVVSER